MRPGPWASRASALAGVTWAAWTVVALGCWAATPVLVEHRERKVAPRPDPLAPISVAFLLGDVLHVPDALRPGSVDPSWMLAWRRQLIIAWQLPARARLASHPLSHLDPVLLSLDAASGTGAAPQPWSNLECAAGETAELDLQVLARTLDGTHLVGVDLRCAGRGATTTMSRWRRLLVQTNALGRAASVVGLETALRARQWPVRPALVRKQPVPVQVVAAGLLASADLDATPAASTGVLDHGALPQPERWQPDAAPVIPPRVVIAFDLHGAPLQLLANGPLLATPGEAAAAVARVATERALAPATSLAPAPLDDAIVAPLWLGKELGLWLLLDLGRRGPDQTVHDAAVAGWRWREGTWRRVDVALPRTADEGRWSCVPDGSAGVLACTFDRPPLPIARGFSARQVVLGGSERDAEPGRPR